MTTLRIAAQQALEALDYWLECGETPGSHDMMQRTHDALRAALAEPEPRNQCGETCERAKLCAVCAGGLTEQQEPVAWALVASNTGNVCSVTMDEDDIEGMRPERVLPLYTAPQPKAEPQDPVAWFYEERGRRWVTDALHEAQHANDGVITPLYTTPQPRRNVTYVCPVCAASLERQE